MYPYESDRALALSVLKKLSYTAIAGISLSVASCSPHNTTASPKKMPERTTATTEISKTPDSTPSPSETTPSTLHTPDTSYVWDDKKCGNESKNKVFLVFDDAPNNKEEASELLTTAKRLNIGIGLMPLGNSLSTLDIPAWEEAGMMVGYHSYDHPQFSRLSEKNIRKHLKHPQITSDVVRPPFGQGGYPNKPYAKKIKRAFAAENKLMCMWDDGFDPEDWKGKKSPATAAATIIEQATPEKALTTVVHLQHLGKDATQLATIKAGLEAKGMELCPAWDTSTKDVNYHTTPYCK